MNYQDFYNKFEEQFKDDFYALEQLRLKMLKAFKIHVLLWVLIPLAIFAILTILLKELIIVVLFYIPIFAIFSPFVFKNKYITIIPLLFILIAGIILTGIFHFKGIVIFYLVVSIAILLEIAMVINLFLRYSKQWNNQFIKSSEMLKLKNSLIQTIAHRSTNNYKNVIITQDLKASGLFMDINYRSVDDEFKGEYKNTPYSISETKLFSTKKDENPEDKIFEGIVIKFEINKKFKNRTIVTTKQNKISINSPASNFLLIILIVCSMYFDIKYTSSAFILCLLLFYPLIVKKRIDPQEDKKFQKVVLEDVKFNKIFNTYSSDQVEARYLLTTSFMERFENLQSTFGAKIIKCSFYDNNKLMIAITTEKDLFEIGSLYKSFYDKDYLKQFYRELSSIYFLINYFKLDEKTRL